jgi:hypothetical protein
MTTTITLDEIIQKLIEECTPSAADREEIPSRRAEILELYTDALLFTTGKHPDGRIGHWEDTNFEWTPEGIIAFDGPCIVNPSPPTKETDDKFIEYYVSSNYWDEGTPIFIDNEIH